MRKAIRVIEMIITVATAIMSVLTIIEVVKAWTYKRKLARKAQDYLEDELIPEENLGNTINVYSPTIKKNHNKVMALLAATGVGCVILTVFRVFRLGRDE